jgi:hypothetical protein
MSRLILPSSLQAPRPNRKARRAAAGLAGTHPFANVQRPHGLPAHLPAPSIKVGWNQENVVMVIVFGPNEVPLPFTPDQTDQLIMALGTAAMKVRELQGEPEDVEVGPEAEALLAESIAKTSGNQAAAGDDDLTYSVSTSAADRLFVGGRDGDLVEVTNQPPVADAVTDFPTD